MLPDVRPICSHKHIYLSSLFRSLFLSARSAAFVIGVSQSQGGRTVGGGGGAVVAAVAAEFERAERWPDSNSRRAAVTQKVDESGQLASLRGHSLEISHQAERERPHRMQRFE